jgi:hypothetical protein
MNIDRRTMILAAGGAALAGGAPAASAAAEPGVILSQGGDPSIALRWAFSIAIFFNQRIAINSGDGRRRVFVPAIGGDVFGPRLQGRVVPYGGADYGTNHGLDAHYVLEASDGGLIYIRNRGYMTHLGPPGPDRVSPPPRKPGAPPDQSFVAPPDSQVPLRMRLTPTFDAPEGPHAWLARTLIVGHGQRFMGPDHTIFTYYEVL